MFWIITILFIVACLFLCLYIPFLNHVGEKEIGIAYPYLELRNAKIEEIEIQKPGSGWHFTDMMTCVSYIQLDTFQTILPTGENIKYWFKPQELPEFLRLVPAEHIPESLDFGRSFKDQLRNFVFSGTSRSFLGVDTLNSWDR